MRPRSRLDCLIRVAPHYRLAGRFEPGASFEVELCKMRIQGFLLLALAGLASGQSLDQAPANREAAVTSVPFSRILGANKDARKAVLKPAMERYQKQFGAERPLSVRVAPAASLHDRLILVDGTEAWVVGQSFNGLAQRAHSSIVRADADLAEQKVGAYGAIWDAASPL